MAEFIMPSMAKQESVKALSEQIANKVKSKTFSNCSFTNGVASIPGSSLPSDCSPSNIFRASVGGGWYSSFRNYNGNIDVLAFGPSMSVASDGTRDVILYYYT